MPSRARAEEAVAAAEAAQGDLVAESPSDPLLLNDFVLSARYGRAGGYYARAVERARRACSLAPARDEFKLTLAESLTSLGHFSGSARGSVTTIVSPRTFARWLAGEKKRPKRGSRKPGRPRTEESVRDLVLRPALETGWEYSRILGDLKKFGIRTVSRSTVINILREAGLDPGPKHGVGSWSEFLTRHAAKLWASDFLTVKTWTTREIVDLSVLFFIHPGTRKVCIGGVSANPDAAWMKQQARNATLRMEEMGHPVTHPIIDRDGKYVKEFDTIFEAEDAKVQRVGARAPNLYTHAERFVQSLRNECLDHYVFCGEKHVRHVLTEYLPTTTPSGRTEVLETYLCRTMPRHRSPRRVGSDGPRR